MKVKVPGYIIHFEQEWNTEEPFKFTFYPFKPSEISGTTIVREETIEIEVPDNYDPTTDKIKALEARMAQERLEFATKMMHLEKQLQNLLSLPNEVK